MEEQIKPVAWYAELDAPNFRDHGQKYGPEWPSSRDRLPAEQTVELDGGLMTIKHQPLYDQQAIDTLREQVNRLFLSGREWATRFGEQEARAERAEAEVERLKEVCDKWSERELLFGAHEDLQARAERAEAEAKIGREFLQRIASQDAAFRPGWVHWCELARQGIAAIDAAKQRAE